VDEADDREALAVRERGLERARERVLGDWAAADWYDEVQGRAESVPLYLVVKPPLPPGMWTMGVSARAVVGSGLSLSALVERARDGFDLPLAAVVAERVLVSSDRSTPWITVEGETEQTLVHLVHPPNSTADRGQIHIIPSPWSLDQGWRILIGLLATSSDDGEGGGLTAPAEGVTILVGKPGQSVGPPYGLAGKDPEHPALLVVTGGADVDLRARGDWWGVVVADGGGAKLEGTSLHGAVLASGAVELGLTGRVVFDPQLLRWATDRSLWRARLMPGSRSERVE